MLQESFIQNVVNHVGMNLDSGICRAAVGSAAKIADAGSGGSNQNDFSLKGTGRKSFLQNIDNGIVREGAGGPLVVDHHLATAVRMKKQRLAEANFDDSLGAIDQIHVLRRRAKIRASRHEIQGRVNVPFVGILGAPIGENQ